MAKLFPSFELIQKMNPEPTPGERWLLKKLEIFLPDDYEVYFQASLEGSFPDIVIVRPNHGVVVIEVKDWNLDLYEVREVDKTWICNPHTQGSCLKTSPFAQAKHYKDLFFSVYSRKLASKTLANKNFYGIVTSIVFFYKSTSSSLKCFFQEYETILKSKYMYYLSPDDFDNGKFEAILKKGYISGSIASKLFTEEIYREFIRILRPSYHSLEKLEPVTWSKDQQRYINSVQGKHKIRGVAGCGKTLVMACRAVDAYKKKHKPVLILTFNITLCNYIHDCISRFRGNISWSAFIIKNYHRFIKDYNNKYGIDPESSENTGYLHEEIPAKFKTILVDEVQDYESDWIKVIHGLLDSEGELVFLGDEEQNIYGRTDNFDNGKLRCYTGVSGQWGTMYLSYRVSDGKVARIAKAFQDRYFSKYDDNEMKPAMQNLFAGDSVDGYYEYHFLENRDDEAIYNYFKQIWDNKPLANDDICILSTGIDVVRKLDYTLRQNNYPTITNFETEEEYQKLVGMGIVNKKDLDEKLEDVRRTAKRCFWMESGKIKLVTVHSYKGWGINTGILIIQGGDKLTNELIYTGITRMKQNLIVINIGNQDYDTFFREMINI